MTIIFVTHDIDEAVYMSDRVVVLSQRPSRVVRVLDVPIERPRDQLSTRASKEFAESRAAVFELVMTKRPSQPGDQTERTEP